MDSPSDWFFNRIICNISAIRSTATRHNGVCSWHFSQMKNPVRSFVGKLPKSKEGICAMMSAHWLYERYVNSHSLRLVLAPPNGHRSQIQSNILQTIGDEQEAYYASSDPLKNWLAWVSQHGVQAADGGSDSGGYVAANARFEVDELFNSMAKKILKFRSLGNRSAEVYIHIDMGRKYMNKMRRHSTILLYTTNQNIEYFDSNYGEFVFNTFDGFKDWYRYMFARSHYSWVLGGDYSICCFQK